MIKGLQQFVLRQKVSRLQRKVKVCNLATAKTALIVYETKEGEEKMARNFARFLKEEGIKVETLAFYQLKNKKDQRPKDELEYNYFDKNDCNWLQFPSEKRIRKTIAKDFDLLIDLNLSNRFCLEFISSLSRAKFKVGAAEGYRTKSCDFTISVSQAELSYLIEQIKVYLKMINN